MRLLSLAVENFRCIRRAKIDFEAGLNVLHGPNDLGKSSLAHAIRAAFLLQTTAKEHEEFISWNGSGEPDVQLVFETEPQRIWRVRKTFGSSGKSFLDESRDGVDFQMQARGRDVDGRLGELLQWGVAPPGGKGRPKGMPATFLSTVLLAEQHRVDAIFEQTLGGDSDESGRKQLIAALQAAAEDPLFKAVLTRVQDRVDEAFTKSGGRKSGKGSPWVQLREQIQEKIRDVEGYKAELARTQALEIEISRLHEQLLQARGAAEDAEAQVQRVSEDLSRHSGLREIALRLADRRNCLDQIAQQFREVSDAELRVAESVRQIAELAEREHAAGHAMAEGKARVEDAQQELARLQSEDRAQQRLLQQTTLDARRAVLNSEQIENQVVLERAAAIEAAVAQIEASEAAVLASAQRVAELQTRRDAARKALSETGEQERSLRAAGQFFRLQTAESDLQQARASLEQTDGWREEAAQKRAAAAALDTVQPKFALPSTAQLVVLQRLDTDIQVAAGKLDVGLSVNVRPKRALRATVQVDGGQAIGQELLARFEWNARRQISLDIEDVAAIELSGGALDARHEFETLQERWTVEAEPFLKAARASGLDELNRLAREAASRAAEIEVLRGAATQLEQRISDQPDWATVVAERQQHVAAAEKVLGDADRLQLQKMARKLKVSTVADVEQRLEAIRAKLDGLRRDEQERNTDLTAEEARGSEKLRALDEARGALARAQACVDGDWQEVRKRILGRQAEIGTEVKSIEEETARLATADDRDLLAAGKKLQTVQEALAKAETAHAAAAQDSARAKEDRARNEGTLNALREAASKLDESGAREAVRLVEVELQQAPVPGQPVNEEDLAEARRKCESAREAVQAIKRAIQEKRGALQQVGGEVARQKAEDAQKALEAIREREQQTEAEYAAWQMLRQTMREAEQEQGAHLGRTLADPIAQRFGDLTGRRYGKLALGANLDTRGIFADGDQRPVSLLSVGTRDQLSTIFRLTLAEYLNSAVVLDDQLAQSDPCRMSWLCDLLGQIAANIQVIVFTCRPNEYPVGGAGTHSVDLLRAIERHAMSAR